MEITRTTQVADVASRYPGTIRVFQRAKVDFCCGGKRPLSEVCDESGLDFEALAGELREAIASAAPEPRPVAAMPLGELTTHIVDRYHAWLREELPRMTAMMDKVLRVHGDRHPELAAVASTFDALRDDLMPHMMKEEHVLFPYIQRLDAEARSGRSFGGSPFGTVENPIRMMEMEHEAVGGLLVELRRLTRDYTAPEDACNTFRGLYHAFAEMERDTHEHIHVENNVLHPRTVELERQLSAALAG